MGKIAILCKITYSEIEFSVTGREPEINLYTAARICVAEYGVARLHADNDNREKAFSLHFGVMEEMAFKYRIHFDTRIASRIGSDIDLSCLPRVYVMTFKRNRFWWWD